MRSCCWLLYCIVGYNIQTHTHHSSSSSGLDFMYLGREYYCTLRARATPCAHKGIGEHIYIYPLFVLLRQRGQLASRVKVSWVMLVGSLVAVTLLKRSRSVRAFVSQPRLLRRARSFSPQCRSAPPLPCSTLLLYGINWIFTKSFKKQYFQLPHSTLYWSHY